MALGLQRSDTMSIIARVRRAMPRNPDVMAICEAYEELIRATRAKAGQTRKRERSDDELERIREQTRLRVQRHRAKKKRKGSR